MLTSANGTSTALIAKITVSGVTPNHMIDSKRPADGRERIEERADAALDREPQHRHVIGDQREQRADDERDRDRRGDMEQRRAEMAEIARAGDEQPQPLRDLDRAWQQIGRRDERRRLPGGEKQQREQMRGQLASRPGRADATIGASAMPVSAISRAARAPRPRCGCPGRLWIIPISFDSS